MTKGGLRKEWIICPACGQNANQNQGGHRFDKLSPLLSKMQAREANTSGKTAYNRHPRARRIDAEPMNL